MMQNTQRTRRADAFSSSSPRRSSLGLPRGGGAGAAAPLPSGQPQSLSVGWARHISEPVVSSDPRPPRSFDPPLFTFQTLSWDWAIGRLDVELPASCLALPVVRYQQTSQTVCYGPPAGYSRSRPFPGCLHGSGPLSKEDVPPLVRNGLTGSHAKEAVRGLFGHPPAYGRPGRVDGGGLGGGKPLPHPHRPPRRPVAFPDPSVAKICPAQETCRAPQTCEETSAFPGGPRPRSEPPQRAQVAGQA